MQKPKTKPKPKILTTREGMEAEITRYLELSLQHAERKAALELEKIECERRHEAELNRLSGEIELAFAAVQNFCELHRAQLLPKDRKSFDTVNATVEFELTPPSVGKISRETFEAIAVRLQGLVFCAAGEPGDPSHKLLLDCAQYVREPAPELDKLKLIADRDKFTPAQLRAMGIKFEQHELFRIKPKSQVLPSETSSVGAAT